MASQNKRKSVKNHEGVKARAFYGPQLLRRVAMTQMLFEDTFYIDGSKNVDILNQAADECTIQELSEIAKEVKHKGLIRHTPLQLCIKLLEKANKNNLGETERRWIGNDIAKCLTRVDDITEITNLWLMQKQGAGKKMPHQLRRAVNIAFNNFDEYQIAKYNRKGNVSLKDCLFLSHAKGETAEQQDIFNRLVQGELKTPDTWETRLSSGQDKKEAFTSLLAEGKLGMLALLRNLRNMHESGVDVKLISEELMRLAPKAKALPFQYVAAARACPDLVPMIDNAMRESIKHFPRLEGRTFVLVDVSGSMFWNHISGRSKLTTMDAAATLACYVEMLSNDGDFGCASFSNKTVDVPRFSGLALIENIVNSQMHGGTRLYEAVKKVKENKKYDRLVVITDEQASDYARPFKATAKHEYIINVAPNEKGIINNGSMHCINGFSQNIIQYIREYEANEQI